MTDTPDTSPTRRFEEQPEDFSPEKNPVLRKVIVKTEVAPGTGIEQQGWTTDIPGAKVELQQIAQHNMNKRGKHQGSMGEYERIYFTTASGTVYCARSLEDGTWELEASNDARINNIREQATIEVGQRFTSPHLVNGVPELDTSPVQNITLVDRYGKPKEYGVSFSDEESDIGTQFVSAVQARGGKIR